MEKEKASVRLGTFVLLVILVAIAFGGAGYLYGINAGKTLTAVTATPTATVSATTSKSVVSSASSTATTATADWNTYINDSYGYSFKYPKDWTKQEFDSNSQVIVSTADTKKLVDDGKLHPGYANNLVVNYYSTVNSQDARGGSWEGQREYSSLADLFTDPKSSKQKIGDTTIGGVSAYEVGIGGLGISFGFMIERTNGIYQLSFERRTNKSELTQEEKDIIASFQFTK
jgi:hypothetical protein